MGKKIKIEIKHWVTGAVLFEYECDDNTIAKTVEEAVKNSANLRYADLRSANLRSANLGSADLRSANLGSADLGSANLRYADLDSADLRYANLHSANLRSANLRSANLRSANLGSANLHSADLRSANLGSADLRSANLRSTDLDSANLRYADLRSAKGINKYFGTDLSLLLLQKNRLTAYKYLDKDMKSPIQSNNKITYEVGSEYTARANPDRLEDCGAGLNIASLEWCLKETQGNLDDYNYIEVSFEPTDLIVPYFSDGKFRVNKLKVERKVTKKLLKEYCGVIK